MNAVIGLMVVVLALQLTGCDGDRKDAGIPESRENWEGGQVRGGAAGPESSSMAPAPAVGSMESGSSLSAGLESAGGVAAELERLKAEVARLQAQQETSTAEPDSAPQMASAEASGETEERMTPDTPPDGSSSRDEGFPFMEGHGASHHAWSFDTKSFHPHLVAVFGEEGNGSGFVGLVDGKAVLVTNCHVLSGNTGIRFELLNSERIETGTTLRIPRDRDVAMLPVKGTTEGLALMEDIESGVQIGDRIVVLGNSMGKGVVTSVEGRVVGIGPDLVEIDAKFASGNSGSPIIHRRSGKVVGVASYTTSESKPKTLPRDRETRFSQTRWFGYRLDHLDDSETVSVKTFAQSGALVKARDELTRRLILFYLDIASDNSMNNHSHYTTERDGLTRAVQEFMDRKGRGILSASELVKQRTSMIRQVQGVCRADLIDPQFRRHPFDNWHKGELNRILNLRRELSEEFKRLETKYGDRSF